jgi:hypothetical protein
MDFSDTLANKLDKNVEALCPKHRNTASVNAWKRLVPEKTRREGVEK